MPLFGAVYREKFVALLGAMPPNSLRGVIIYNHGCGGQWGWETTVSQILYRYGFAVITPDFAGRDENQLGCPGGSESEMLAAGAQRAREGVFQAINPARLAARAHEILLVADWLKQRTRLPILIGGHSEGCRATYALHVSDPQIVGGFCVKQGLQSNYEHTWRWNPKVPMWQSLEEFDPWVVFPPGATVKDVTFERKFKEFPENLTVVIVPGRTHDPLNQEAERLSLTAWLNARVSQPLRPGQAGFNFESVLPEIQRRLRAP
jgi:dienelactone hydrolase